jgi:glycosyltransferase involved in cell wall biosynthesis
MRDINTLIITYYFPPADFGATNRLLRLLPFLVEQGLHYTVVTIARDDIRLSDDRTLLDSLIACQKVERAYSLEPFRTWDSRGVKRANLSSTGTSNRNEKDLRSWLVQPLKPLAAIARRAFAIPDSAVGWYPFAVRRALQLCQEEQFDLIFSTVPAQTAHLVARTVARKTGIPWVADFRDAWFEYGRRYSRPEWEISNWMLNGVVKDSSALAFTSNTMRKVFCNRFPQQVEKMHYIPHGIVELPKLPPIDKPSGELWIGHIGTLDRLRDPSPLIEALQFLRGESPALYERIRVKIVGAISPDIARQLLACSVKDRFDMVGFVSREESIRWMQRCDCLALFLSDISNIGYGASASKIYDYLGARKPILAIVPEGNISQIIRDTRAGKTFLPNQGKQAGEWLIQLLNGKITISYHQPAVECLRAENAAAQLWNVFEQVIAS